MILRIIETDPLTAICVISGFTLFAIATISAFIICFGQIKDGEK